MPAAMNSPFRNCTKKTSVKKLAIPRSLVSLPSAQRWGGVGEADGGVMTPPSLRGTSPRRGEDSDAAQPPFFLKSARIFSTSSLVESTSSPSARVTSFRRLKGYLASLKVTPVL